jgi:hypothetical protein
MLIDSGSDLTLLSAKVAEDLGIDLSRLSKASLTTALGTAAEYTPFQVTLELRRFPRRERWKGWVGFLAFRTKYSILGTKGFFEFFAVTYDWHQQTIDIDRGGQRPP